MMDASDIEAHVLALQDACVSENKESIKKAVMQLSQQVPPAETTRYLARFLFQSTNSIDTNEGVKNLTPDKVLMILHNLVQVNPGLYVTPVVRSIHEEVSKPSFAASSSIHVPPALSTALLHLIEVDNVQVSSLASDSLVKLQVAKVDPDSNIWEQLATLWQNAWQNMPQNPTKYSTFCIRYASTTVSLVLTSDSMMQEAKKAHSLDLMIEMLELDSDPLLQISVLELFEQMANTSNINRECVSWLISRPVTEPILQMANRTTNSLSDSLLAGPALKTLASFCKMASSQQVSLEDSRLLEAFYQVLVTFEANNGETDRLVMIDAISSFASLSAETLRITLQDKHMCYTWLNLATAQPQLKSAILMSVSLVIDGFVKAESKISNATTGPLELYATVGAINNNANTTDLLRGLASTPLLELRLAVYAVWKSIARLSTGAQVLLTQTGYLDYILERSETSQAGREGKYGVVEAIYNSPVKNLLADEIVAKLDSYLQKGPHYVETKAWTEVMEQ